MAGQGRRKYQTLDVVNMYATLTEAHWRQCLELALSKNNVEKLKAWRYGLQAGLADAGAKGLSTPQIDIWVLKRIRNLEKCMQIILRRKYKNPLDKVNKFNARKDPQAYLAKVKMAKKMRDAEFANFLKDSSF